MQKRKANIVISGLVTISLFFSPMLQAIELQTKTKNTDKSNYNVTPSVNIIPGKYSFFAETNYSLNPLVTRGTFSGKVNPLVKGILGLDLIANYGINDWAQVGILLPLEMPMGTEKSGLLMSGALLEAKFKVLDYLAIVPMYQLPSSSSITVNNEGVMQDIKLGAPKGAFGAKLVGEIGDINSSWGMAAQLGFISSPENKFSTIDQSSRILMSVSGGRALGKNMSGVVEIYGEKTPSNFPIEVIGFLNFKGESLNFQVGGGSGDIQGSGSNTVKAFVGLSYSFGGEKKGWYRPSKSNQNWNRVKDTKQPQYLEDGIDEQNGPKVLEPEETKEPMIPDVDSSFVERPFRGLASVENDPLAEILNEDKKTKKVKQEIKEAVKTLEKEQVENKKTKPIVENKDKVAEPVKKVEKKAKKKKEQVDFSKSRLETLSDGQKVRVFEKEVNILPKEVGVIYTTEKGLKEMKNKILAQEKELKENQKEIKLQEQKTVESKAVETPITLEVKPMVKEEDPIPLVGEHQEILKQEDNPEIVPITESAKENIVKEQKEQKIEVVEKVEESSKDQEKSLELPLAEEKSLVKEDKPTANPITLETVRKSKEELKKILEEELSVSTELRMEDIKKKAKEENEKVQAEMNKIQEKKAAEEKALVEQKQAEEYAQKEKEIRTEKELTEGPESQTPKAPATDKELKAVKIDNKKNRSISLPKLKAFLDGKKEDKEAIVSPSSEELNLLEETDSLEEASGPNYGFGEE